MEGFRSTYGYMVALVLALLALVHTVALLAAMGYHVAVTKIIVAGAFFMFGLMGNRLGKVRRNFFLGVRVPWTLANERVWNETHRLAAWVGFCGGLMGSAVALLSKYAEVFSQDIP
jgi:uncharacterized membrane protein